MTKRLLCDLSEGRGESVQDADVWYASAKLTISRPSVLARFSTCSTCEVLCAIPGDFVYRLRGKEKYKDVKFFCSDEVQEILRCMESHPVCRTSLLDLGLEDGVAT